MKKSWKTFNQESGNPELMSSPEYDGGLFHTCVDPIYFIGFKSFRYTSRFVVKCFNLMCVWTDWQAWDFWTTWSCIRHAKEAAARRLSL